MDGVRVIMVVVAVVAALGSATSSQQQQPYSQPQPYAQQASPQQQQQPYPQQQQQPYQQQQPQDASLRCGQLLTECYRCTNGSDCATQCVQTRGTPRAQWLHLAIVRCSQVQNCRVAWCVEQGCQAQMAACRADAAGPADPMLPVPFVGEWYYGGVSVVGFYSATSGWSPASSKGGSYKFSPDGTYEHALMLETRSFSCALGAAEWTTGTYAVQGNQLSLVEKQHIIRSGSECGTSSSSASNAPLEKHVYTMQFLPDEFGGDAKMTLFENGTAISDPYSHR